MKIEEAAMTAVITACGGDAQSTAQDFSDIPLDLVMKTAQAIPTEVAYLTPMAVGKIGRWHRRCCELGDTSSSSASKGARDAAPKQPSRPIIQLTLPKPVPQKRKVRDVLEQGETVDTVDILSADDLLRLRYRYFKKMGGDPPEYARPSYSQFSALKQKLDDGLAPIRGVCGVRPIWRDMGETEQVHRTGVDG